MRAPGVVELVQAIAEGRVVLASREGAVYEHHDGRGRKVAPTFKEPDQLVLVAPGGGVGPLGAQVEEAAWLLAAASVTEHTHEMHGCRVPATTIVHTHPAGGSPHDHDWRSTWLP